MDNELMPEEVRKKWEEDIKDATRSKKEKLADRFSNIVSSRRSKLFMIFTGIMLLPWGVFALVHWKDIVDIRHVEELGDKLEWIGGVGLGYVVIFGFAFVFISIIFTLVFCAGFTSYFRRLSIASEGYIKPAVYNLISIVPMVWLLAWIVHIDKMSITLLTIISWCLVLLSLVERPLNKWFKPFSFMQLIKKQKNEQQTED